MKLEEITKGMIVECTSGAVQYRPIQGLLGTVNKKTQYGRTVYVEVFFCGSSWLMYPEVLKEVKLTSEDSIVEYKTDIKSKYTF